MQKNCGWFRIACDLRAVSDQFAQGDLTLRLVGIERVDRRAAQPSSEPMMGAAQLGLNRRCGSELVET